MLRIAICDDSQLWLQKIETLTRGYLKKINVKYRLDLYQSGEKLLKSITSICIARTALKSPRSCELPIHKSC